MNVTCKCTIFKFTKKCQSQTKTRTETRYQHPPLTSEPTTMTLWYRVLKPPSLPTTIWHWDWAVGIKHHKALGSDIILLNFVKLSTLLIERDGHKRYTLPAALVVVWALWSFKIFIWTKLRWWALEEQNSNCLQIDLV